MFLTRRLDVLTRLQSRFLGSSALQNIIIQVPKSSVYRFGDPNSAQSVFRDLEWTVREGESWAVIGSGSGKKTTLLEVGLFIDQNESQNAHRVADAPRSSAYISSSILRSFPFLYPASGPSRDPFDCVSLVSFAHRPRASGSAFYDYTARYGAVREEDRLTLRQSMFSDIPSSYLPHEVKTEEETTMQKKALFEQLTEKLGLSNLLDLPLVALSNGQTRRARIVKAILRAPELLLLDEPLTGLDVQNRPTLLVLLRSLHESRSPRVIMGLRIQDPIPEWITHVALVQGESVITGRKEELAATILHEPDTKENSRHATRLAQEGKVLVDLKNVNVGYHGHERKVLKGINWTIRQGDRWHLRGANGSGKTTLLSILTGDHPQSYTQIPPSSHLTLFDKPRSRIATPHLRALIGVVSPEMSNAFPRRQGMTVWDAVGTGFDGVFVPSGDRRVGVGLTGGLREDETEWRIGRMREVLRRLGPSTWSQGRVQSGDAEAEAFAARQFVDLSAGEQSVVLLMRALVGRPQLVLLDEVWSGMDEGMVRAARAYLREDAVGDDQAVVVISHWEDEVPWSKDEGVKRFQLENGEGKAT